MKCSTGRRDEASSVIAGWVVLSLLASVGAAAEWPHWRGPNRDGSVGAEDFVEAWLERGLRECWRRPVGPGYASMAVVDQVVYSMEMRRRDDYLVAFSSADGQEIWSLRVGPSSQNVYGGTGPRVMPTVSGGVVYAASTDAVLVAADRHSGLLLWRLDLRQRLGARGPAEGYASSPLALGDRLFVMVGGGSGRAYAALDRSTGEVLWTSQDDRRASYSSPIPWSGADTEQILFLGASKLVSLAPEDGRLLWRYPWPTYDDVNVATPLPLPGDRVFISSGYDQGAAMLRVDRKGGSMRVEEVWRNRVMKNHFNSSVHVDGTIYGFDEAFLQSVDAATGEPGWRQRGLGKGSLLAVGDHLVVLSERGELVLVDADPEAYRERARLGVLDGRSWTPPALAGERIYLRNRRELVCLEPTPAGSAATDASP